MMIVGLTGSIGMGKSTVAEMLREINVPVQDADLVVHELYSSPELVSLIGDKMPDAVVFGVVDRNKLAAALQKDPLMLEWLESLIHPRVRKKQAAFLKQQKDQGQAFAVLEIPLLFEKSDPSMFDYIVTVSAPETKQRERVLERSGMTEDKFEYLLYKQWPDEKKRTASDHVIENSGDLFHLDQDVRAFALTLVEEARQRKRQEAWDKWIEFEEK